ncbi:MAG: DUF2189 domain-containing protein [Burkholderiales bacterium]|nr:DUF2189 domain-containing protein [Burkholderiales bacterium]
MATGESVPATDPAAVPAPDAPPANADAAAASFLIPIARDVAPREVLEWLKLGWQDLVRSYLTGVWFGVCFVAMGALLMLTFRQAPAWLMAIVSGFLLVGPFLCTGCYAISRALERGGEVRIRAAALAFRDNTKNLALFAAVLGVLELLWGRASLVVFALFYQGGLPDSGDVLAAFLTLKNVPFVIAYTLVGAIFATLAFVVSAVAMPLMLDRGTDGITAALTSVRVCLAAPLTLALWALCIAALTLAAMLPGFVGLIVVGPWLGHATWHAYRRLVPPAPAVA